MRDLRADSRFEIIRRLLRSSMTGWAGSDPAGSESGLRVRRRERRSWFSRKPLSENWNGIGEGGGGTGSIIVGKPLLWGREEGEGKGRIEAHAGGIYRRRG